LAGGIKSRAQPNGAWGEGFPRLLQSLNKEEKAFPRCHSEKEKGQILVTEAPGRDDILEKRQKKKRKCALEKAGEGWENVRRQKKGTVPVGRWEVRGEGTGQTRQVKLSLGDLLPGIGGGG